MPFLLLKDKLHSQIDSTGTSALVHMCSHNSPYLPLYLSTLKQGDPLLDRPTNLGHTPLDVAGMYCRKEYVELLRAKGAKDEGRVDAWAIQGGNIDNWSGNVDPTKKVLIHWAAFNNLPQVLQRFHEAGANVDQADDKGNTPIDMAVINKSYESVEVLARLGFRPKQTLIDKAESPYFHALFKELDRSRASRLVEQTLKLSFIPLFLLSQLFLSPLTNPYIILLTFLVFLLLAVRVPGPDSKARPTAFFSELVNQQIVLGYNHLPYVCLMVLLVVAGLQTLLTLSVDSLALGLYFWVVFGVEMTFVVNLGVMVYGIATNTTPSEMFESHKHPQLWKKIDYLIHRNIVTRVYKNPNRKDLLANLQAYINYRPE